MPEVRKVHRSCGGEVKHRKCSKCGHTWNRLTYIFANDIKEVEVKFDPAEYKKRIRSGRDL
jgi:hypothetical protein